MFKRICKYKKISKIGEGSYGIVYKAKDLQTNQFVALKKIRLKPEEEGTPSTAIREIALLKELNQLNIVNLIDVIHTSSKLTLVFEYCESDLKKIMDNLKTERLPIPKVKLYLYQMLKATTHLYKHNILHRDLKPANMLINSDDVLKLCDFGLARGIDVPIRMYTNEVVTLWYRAPDILLGSKLYDISVDIWSIGCIFAEMLLGIPMFLGKNENEQLDRMFLLLGTPDDEVYTWLRESPEWGAYITSDIFKKYEKKNIRDLYTSIDDEDAYDLLEQMIVFDPDKRIKPEDALKHKYFNSIKKEISNIANLQNNIDAKIKADVKSITEATISELYKINDEVNSNKEKLVALEDLISETSQHINDAIVSSINANSGEKRSRSSRVKTFSFLSSLIILSANFSNCITKGNNKTVVPTLNIECKTAILAGLAT